MQSSSSQVIPNGVILSPLYKISKKKSVNSIAWRVGDKLWRQIFAGSQDRAMG